jgi:hypothetical protein
MKKFVKILSTAAIASLFIGGTVSLSSCGDKKSNTNTTTTETKPAESTTKKSTDAEDKEACESLANLIAISASGSKVDSDFTVPAYVGSGDDKTLIEWISNDTSLLTFEHKDGDSTYKAVVHRPASDSKNEYSKVTFYAKVTKGSQSSQTDEFNVRVRREVTAQEYYEEWITTMGVTHNFGGYVIAKVGYISNYKECNLILWDTEVNAAYLAYQGYMDEKVYNELALGTYVSVKGATNTLYNGLVETKYGATFTADSTKKIDVSTITRTSLTEAIIKDTLVNEKNSATEQGLKLQNSYVSLEGFTIKSISESYSKTSGTYGTTYQTLATLTRYGQDIDVVIAEGITPFASSKEVYDNIARLKVGAQVSVKGILGWNNKPVIILTGKDDISKVAADYTDAYVDYDKSYTAAITAASNVKSIYFSSADVELPVTNDNGATLTYSVSGECLSYDETTHKLTITAAEASKDGKLTITAKSGEITYTKTIDITAQALNDKQFAEKVANELKLDSEVSAPTAIELAVKDTYGMEATIAWTVTLGSDVATVTDKNYLEVVPLTTDSTIKVKAVITYKEQTAEKEFTISVKKIEVSTIEEVSKAEYDSTKESWYCVEGYVTSTYGSYGGCYIDTTVDGLKKTFCVFKPTDLYGNLGNATNYAGKKFEIGSKIKVYGLLAQYNNVNQFSTSYILDVQEPDDTAKVIINLNTAKESFKSVYYSATTVTLPEGVTATVKSGTSVTTDGQKVTIAATTEKVENVITLTSVSGGVAKTAEVTFSTEEYVIPSGEQTLKLDNSNKLNISSQKASVNFGEYFEIPEKLLTIYQTADSSCALNSGDPSLRIYSGKTITIASSSVIIKSIKVTYNVGQKEGNLIVTPLNGTEVKGEAVSDTHTTDTFTVNSNSVNLKANSKQVRITSIEIVYQKAE